MEKVIEIECPYCHKSFYYNLLTHGFYEDDHDEWDDI